MKGPARGVLPAALVGSSDLDVTSIDVASIRLEGVPALRGALADVGSPYAPHIGKSGRDDCTYAGPD